jgi:hypothetical protein
VRSGEGTLAGAGSQLLFLSSSTGMLHIVDASTEKYAERTAVQVLRPDVRAVTGPSMAAGRIYVRNLREIAAFEINPAKYHELIDGARLLGLTRSPGGGCRRSPTS